MVRVYVCVCAYVCVVFVHGVCMYVECAWCVCMYASVYL